MYGFASPTHQSQAALVQALVHEERITSQRVVAAMTALDRRHFLNPDDPELFPSAYVVRLDSGCFFLCYLPLKLGLSREQAVLLRPDAVCGPHVLLGLASTMSCARESFSAGRSGAPAAPHIARGPEVRPAVCCSQPAEAYTSTTELHPPSCLSQTFMLFAAEGLLPAMHSREPSLRCLQDLSAHGCRITHCLLGESRPSAPPTCMPQRCSCWSSRLAPAHPFWMLAQASHKRCTPHPSACLRLAPSTDGPLHRRSSFTCCPCLQLSA